jgi:hypothetical protein
MNRLFTGNVYKYNMIYVLYDLHEFLFSIGISAMHIQRTDQETKNNTGHCGVSIDIFKQLEAPRSLYSSPGYNNNISQ